MKETIPGQKGHIPNTKETFACSQGTMVNSKAGDPTDSSLHVKQVNTDMKWRNGPKDKDLIRRIPGYSGYIPHIQSENIQGMTYANTNKKLTKNPSKLLDKLNSSQATTNSMAYRERNSRNINSPRLVSKAQNIQKQYISGQTGYKKPEEW